MPHLECEREELKILSLTDGRRTVERIPYYWYAERRSVEADLMRAPGERLRKEYGRVFGYGGPGDRFRSL